MIIGIDEVGRGCWAGPLCVAAVDLGNADIDGLTDSKLLNKIKREYFAERIIREARAVGIGWVSAAALDKIGLSRALTVAAENALGQIHTDYDEIILDGTYNFLNRNDVTVLKKADLLIPAVSAASVVAKVARDKYMESASSLFPGYGFESHVGYGTVYHKKAIKELGPCPIHRMSFSPLRNIHPSININPRLTSGVKGEKAAAVYLRSQGFSVIDTNWKTKWCEIDIIASKADQLHFVEVKYRKNRIAGSGFEYITRQKQKQMKFAAEYWLLKNPQRNNNTQFLSAIELSGSDYKVDNFVTLT